VFGDKLRESNERIAVEAALLALSLIILVFLSAPVRNTTPIVAARQISTSYPAPELRTIKASNGKMMPEVMVDAPNLYPLQEGVEHMEEMLKSGRWLVIVYGQDSSNDIHISRQTPRLSKVLEGICRVAIRPTRRFQTFEADVKKWLPELTYLEESTARPHFILLDDGRLTSATGGYMTEADLKDFVHSGSGPNAID
jgi:hypothetical protein